MLEILVKFFTVLALGAAELWAAVPAGFALGLHPALTGIAAALGALSSATAVALAGERIRGWLLRRHKAKGSRIHKIWDRYGVAGLGLLSPLFTGAALGAALGIALGARARRLILWMGIGIALWSAVLTLGLALGISGIEALAR